MQQIIVFSDTVFDEDVSQPISVENGVMRVRIGSTAYIVDGFTVQIVCNATSLVNELSVTISWYRNGEHDQKKKTRGNVSMIIVTDANHGDVFTCVVENVPAYKAKTTNIIFVNKHFCI